MKAFFITLCVFLQANAYEPWTWTYRYMREKGAKLQQGTIVFTKERTHLFNQLIYSWNCKMPSHGYFSFFVQVRHEKGGKWSDWIHMADWGVGVKKTYLQKENGYNFHHVRLELGDSKAQGFKVKVIKSDGCDCDIDCDGLSVCVSDLQKMVPDECIPGNMKSCYISGIPFLSQFSIDHPKNHALCSPTSCTMLLRYYLGKPYDPADVAQAVYDEGLGIYGSWPCNMAAVYALSRGKLSACVTRLDHFKTLYHYLARGIPVCVSVRGPLAGSATPYASGHILVVKGFDADTQEVICNDPAFEFQDERGTRYPLQNFLQAWERSKRLAYIIMPK